MKINYNNNWKLVLDKTNDISNYTLKDILKHKAKKVSIPHTINNLDGQDGGGDYKRCVFYYYKKIDKTIYDLVKSNDAIIYLEFEGVNSICDVYLDDEKLHHNEGGFHTFRVNITKDIINKKYIIVKVDNRENDYVYPQFADFTFFGGIYRDVNIIKVKKCHFDLDYYGSSGIKVTSEVDLETKEGKINVECFINEFKDETIHLELYSVDGSYYKEFRFSSPKFEIVVPDCNLWSPEAPNIYRMNFSLTQNDKVIDYRNIDTAFRVYEVKEDGFYLNGVNYPLRGVSRHQDRLNKGWAINVNDQLEDIRMIKELGCNSIRLAHYQHSELFYDLCSLSGLIVWCEVPYISSDLKNGFDNIMFQMKNLCIQTYNNPAVIIIGLSNEITIASNGCNLEEKHQKLNSLVKSICPHKLTTIANVSMEDVNSNLNKIPDLVSYNHYFGWYMGDVKEYEAWYKSYNKLCGLSEYGCEANILIHSNTPHQGDYSEEYQAYYHEEVLKQLYYNTKVWCMYVWNMFDFASDNRQEGGVKGRNNKGLVTYDRKIKKDSFYIYKAYMNKKDKFIHITKKRFKYQDTNNFKLKLYSNLDECIIYVNNKYYGKVKIDKVYETTITYDKKLNIKVYDNNMILYDSFTFIYNPKKSQRYVLKNNDEVVNWFNDSTFKIDPNYYSIKDKLKDIMTNEEGKAYIDSLFEKMSKDAHIPNGILKIVYNFTIERISQMAKSHFPKEVVLEINSNLQKIKK